MSKEDDLRRLEQLKQSVLQQIKMTFGAAVNGPTFVKKFEEIFAEAEADINKTEEDDHGRTSEQAG